MTPYYADDLVTLYVGDCREVTGWLGADVLVTDPPWGRNFQPRRDPRVGYIYNRQTIAGDTDTTVRDAALAMWTPRLAIVFGDLRLAPALGTKQVLIYRKPPDAGTLGTAGGWRHDVEAVYLLGPWPVGWGGRSSVIGTSARTAGGPTGASHRYGGHPHAKPVDVMETLISACPPGVIADPFAGSGSTLVAARNLGRRSIGVEIDERYAEMAARRLAQGVLPLTLPSMHGA